jgi:hypothetical protein
MYDHVEVGTFVLFKDEFGNLKRGKVVTNNPYNLTALYENKKLFVGIDTGSYGIYVRNLQEVTVA